MPVPNAHIAHVPIVPPMPQAPLPQVASPSTRARIPIEPQATKIVFGVLLLILGGWLLASWLPAHAPMSTGQAVLYVADGIRNLEDRTDHWMFRAPVYQALRLLAVLLVLAGIEQIVTGALHRAHKRVMCRRCQVDVVGKKTFGGVACPTGRHLAQAYVVRWILIAVLGAIATLCAVALALR